MDEDAYQQLQAKLVDLWPTIRSLQWDHARHAGVVFHMLSALPVAGRVGLTAVEETPAAADALYEGARDRLLAARATRDDPSR